MRKRVVVVGAGVVGLMLAKELAAGGIDVTVYDSKASVAANTAKASGIFSAEGLARIGVDFRAAVVNRLDGAIIHAGGEEMVLSAKGTKAYVLDRGEFAEICARDATGAGAGLVMGRRLSRDELAGMRDDPEVVLVGADGAVSTVASACGFPEIREYVLTYKAEYMGAVVRDSHKVELFFSKAIASRFFGWTVPYSGSVMEVGIGISSKARRNSSAAFSSFIGTPEIREMLSGACRTAGYASMIPLDWRRRTVIGNTLLVGDAAGQVKATTGGGIIFGAACAKIAARAIAAHIRVGRPLSDYERMWRREHGLDLRLHRIAHSYYSLLGERSFAAMIRLGRVFGLDSFLGTYGDMDRPTVILKRVLFRRAGD